MENNFTFQLKRILEIWFLRKIEMAGLETEGLDLDEGEVAEVLETNIRRDRARLREEARREGREEGKDEGFQEGIYAVARRMASMGEEIEKIAKATGLSEEDVKKLLRVSKSGE
ncbi:MAG: hypothetical protein AB2L14_23295 [Candidatus Xenobiia bacterium LiM19]